MMNIDNLEKWHFELTEGACNYLLDLVLKVIFEEFEVVEIIEP